METGMETLLISGWTNTQDNTGTIELVTETRSCEANMPELPVGSNHGAATVMGQVILYCGGHGQDPPHWKADCYTYSMERAGDRWEEVESMEYPRGHFSMASYEGKAYAIGGESDYGWGTVGHTVEVFVAGQGWTVDTTMQMGCTRRYHCSVMIDSRIIIIGGQCAGTPYHKGVAQFDLKAEEKAWKNLANTFYGRQNHGCTVGAFQGMDGIYIAGGSNSGHTLVEFYVDKSNRWRKLPPMKYSRYHLTISVINSTIYAHGGHGAEAKQEKFKHNWSELVNLSKSRKYHSSVSVPQGMITCNGMDNAG